MPTSSVVAQVRTYLHNTYTKFRPGSDEYFAREALEVAVDSVKAGNYGIGAVAVVRHDGKPLVYRGGNAMVTGVGLIDHAETTALLRMASQEVPDSSLQVPDDCTLTDGHIAVFGTLEPCPMCASVMTNAGVTRSVSIVVDGALVREGEYLVSNGAANVLDEKCPIQPAGWRAIQTKRGLHFQALETTDHDLTHLSLRIFSKTRGTSMRGSATDRPWAPITAPATSMRPSSRKGLPRDRLTPSL